MIAFNQYLLDLKQLEVVLIHIYYDTIKELENSVRVFIIEKSNFLEEYVL